METFWRPEVTGPGGPERSTTWSDQDAPCALTSLGPEALSNRPVRESGRGLHGPDRERHSCGAGRWRALHHAGRFALPGREPERTLPDATVRAHRKTFLAEGPPQPPWPVAVHRPTHRVSPLQRRTRRDDLAGRRARIAVKIRTMADTAHRARTRTHLHGLQTFP